MFCSLLCLLLILAVCRWLKQWICECWNCDCLFFVGVWMLVLNVDILKVTILKFWNTANAIQHVKFWIAEFWTGWNYEMVHFELLNFEIWKFETLQMWFVFAACVYVLFGIC